MKTIYKVIIIIIIIVVLIYYFNNKNEYIQNNSTCTNNEECDSKLCAYINRGKGICKVNIGGSCKDGNNECFKSNCKNGTCSA